jgi:integral membrane protein
VKAALSLYRVLATVVGISIIVLVLVAVPLNHAHDVWPGTLPEGSTGQQAGQAISAVLGTAHGFIYMGFLLVAFWLSRLARWSIAFTAVTLVCGTIPILSFWAESRAIRQVRSQLEAAEPTAPVGS